MISESQQLSHLEGMLSGTHVWQPFSQDQQEGKSVVKVLLWRNWRSGVEYGTSEWTDDCLWVKVLVDELTPTCL